MTRKKVVDHITRKFPKSAKVNQTYQNITKPLNERNRELLASTILNNKKKKKKLKNFLLKKINQKKKQTN
ncbi:hypothetical protein BBP12_11060 [Limosilactobacillus reuteri]|nr:hypothetical protein BBP12_11060 [Limosilactobacillus reuteri]